MPLRARKQRCGPCPAPSFAEDQFSPRSDGAGSFGTTKRLAGSIRSSAGVVPTGTNSAAPTAHGVQLALQETAAEVLCDLQPARQRSRIQCKQPPELAPRRHPLRFVIVIAAQ